MQGRECDLVLALPYGLSSQPTAMYSADVAAAIRAMPCHKVFVYSKGQSCTAMTSSDAVQNILAEKRIQCVELSVLGGDQHTWLSHIIREYDQFSNNLFFIPLPIDKEGRDDFMAATLRSMAYNVTFDCERMVPEGYTESYESQSAVSRLAETKTRGHRIFPLTKTPDKDSFLGTPHDGNATLREDGSRFPLTLFVSHEGPTNGYFAGAYRFGSWGMTTCGSTLNMSGPCLDYFRDEEGVAPADVRPLWAWQLRHLGTSEADLAQVPVCTGNIARTSRDNLMRTSLETYATLLTHLEGSGSTTEAALYMERLMAANFGPELTSWSLPPPPPLPAPPSLPMPPAGPPKPLGMEAVGESTYMETYLIVGSFLVVSLAIFGALCCLGRWPRLHRAKAPVESTPLNAPLAQK